MHIYLSELGPEHIPEIINGKGVLPSLFVLICTRNSNTHSSKKQKHTRRLWCPRKTAPRPRVEDYLANHCQQWLSEGTATCSQTLHELVSPAEPVIPYFMPSSNFYPIAFVFPHIPAAGSCLPTLSAGCSGLCDTRVCLCVHVHIVAPGLTDPSGG